MKIQFLDFLSENFVEKSRALLEVNSFYEKEKINEVLTKHFIRTIHVYDVNKGDIDATGNVNIYLTKMFIPNIIFHVFDNTPKICVGLSYVNTDRILIKSHAKKLDVKNEMLFNISHSSVNKIYSVKTCLSLYIKDSFMNAIVLTSCKVLLFNAVNSFLNGLGLYENDIVKIYVEGCDLPSSVFRYNVFTHIDVKNSNLKNSSHTANSLTLGEYKDGFHNCQYFNNICPKEGSFIGWKKCYYGDEHPLTCLVKLLIPEDAKRSSATSDKCRCSKAVVLEIITLSEQPENIYEAYSWYDTQFIYKQGETVEPNFFDDDPLNECSTGIHFFANRELAADYTI